MPYIGQAPTSTAFLTDSFSGNGSTTAFTMSVAPANTASVLVAVSGVLQDPSTYSVSGLTLTFSAAPPTGTGNISVRYLGIPASGVTTTAYRTITEFTATAGQTTFTPPSYTVGFIEVYRNGVLLGSADYTATNGTTVVLAVGATAGDLVTTLSFYVSSVLNAIPATAGSVGSTYIANSAVGSSQLASNLVLSGNTTKPNQVQFFAYGSGAAITSGTLPYSNATVNIGGGYNASTYTFTAPVAGTYLICSQHFSTSTSAGSADFQKNGVGIGRFGTEGSMGNYTGWAGHIIVPLAVNDTLKIALFAGTITVNTSLSFFSGYLLG